MNKTRLLISGLTLAAVGAGVSACTPSNAAQGAPGGKTNPSASAANPGAGSGMGSGVTVGSASVSTAPGAYILQSMPAGTVSVQRGSQGQLQAHIVMYGLTPGSAHDVVLAGPGSLTSGHVLQFPAVTADATGQVDTTLTAAGSATRRFALSRFVIKLGTSGSSGGSALAAEPIAESGLLPIRAGSAAVVAFHSVSSDSRGVSVDQPAGRATFTYNAAAQTLTVSVTAYGLPPGPHAAHIHLGSCQSQGGVKYMMADFVADGSGVIVNQTRVITGVSSVPGPGNWYFNLHLGAMNQILANGMPTLSFRPLLCTNITSFATTGGSPSPASSTTPSSSPSMTMMPTGTPTSMSSASPSPVPTSSPSPSPSSPTVAPTGQPSHW